MSAVRRHTRQFEKDRVRFFQECASKHLVCWLCGMPIDYAAKQNTTDDSYNLDHMFPVSKHPELQHVPTKPHELQPAARQQRPASTDRNTVKTMDQGHVRRRPQCRSSQSP